MCIACLVDACAHLQGHLGHSCTPVGPTHPVGAPWPLPSTKTHELRRASRPGRQRASSGRGRPTTGWSWSSLLPKLTVRASGHGDPVLVVRALARDAATRHRRLRIHRRRLGVGALGSRNPVVSPALLQTLSATVAVLLSPTTNGSTGARSTERPVVLGPTSLEYS
jgi:hypothetical protein